MMAACGEWQHSRLRHRPASLAYFLQNSDVLLTHSLGSAVAAGTPAACNFWLPSFWQLDHLGRPAANPCAIALYFPEYYGLTLHFTS